jgi:hypothetical protein
VAVQKFVNVGPRGSTNFGIGTLDIWYGPERCSQQGWHR